MSPHRKTCKTCKHVRTAEEIGLSHETLGDWPAPLFCGRQVPPVSSGGRAVSLPHPDGLKNMSCYEPDDGIFALMLTEADAKALWALFEWRAELLRAAPLARGAQIDISAIIERVTGALGHMRSRGLWKHDT